MIPSVEIWRNHTWRAGWTGECAFWLRFADSNRDSLQESYGERRIQEPRLWRGEACGGREYKWWGRQRQGGRTEVVASWI
jgi:hypothetical protein